MRFHRNMFNNLRLSWPVFFLAIILSAGSCSIIRPGKQAQVERKQAKESEKARAEYDKAVKEHVKHQKKETRKMMKKTRKKAEGFNRFMKKPAKRSPGC